MIHKNSFGSHRLANWLNEQDVPTKGKALVWRATTIRSLLRNPTYIGKLRFGDDLSDEIPRFRLMDDYYYVKANELRPWRHNPKNDVSQYGI